jgi:hypothetical protein
MATASKVPDILKMVYCKVTESGANTLTFSEFETGFGSNDQIGWYIQRVEIQTNVYGLTNANQDLLDIVIATSNQITNIGMSQAAIKMFMEITRVEVGTAASGSFVQTPFIRDFGNIEGGGILVLPKPLYLGARGSSLTGASTTECRLYVKEVALQPQEWMQLVEQTRLLS